jgi:hypothetical protein
MNKSSNTFVALSAALATLVWSAIIILTVFSCQPSYAAGPVLPAGSYATGAVVITVDGLLDSAVISESDGVIGVVSFGNLNWSEEYAVKQVIERLRQHGAVIDHELQTPCDFK